ncbi:hypothetical protein BD560DRAFT_337677 [Blakeslea trispora]|nr:hypothetical protein BD560DRAFT_337677 [Blakeslea trispora]
MGFCIYCNQSVYSSTTCPKCYRTISRPLSTSAEGSKPLFPTQKILSQANSDKWQDTYGKKAIFNSGLGSPTSTTNTPNLTRPQRKMPQFNRPESPQQAQSPKSIDKSKLSSSAKCCAHCQQPQNSWADLTMYNSLYYCKTCLEQKLACPGCHQPVNRTDAQAYFRDQIWHVSCFQCDYCKNPLKTMLATVDGEGKPCCRSCQLTEVNRLQQMPSPGSPSISTPLLPSLTSSRSTTVTSSSKPGDNPYFQLKRSRRTSMFSTPKEEETKRHSIASITQRIASATQATSPPEALCTSPSTMTEQDLKKAAEPKEKTSPRRKKVVKKPCKECGQHVFKKDYRGLRIPTGELLCFHSHCLLCAKCNQKFNGLEFCTDGKNFYHIECSDIDTAAVLPRHSSPLSEDEAFPRTPSPQNANFDVLSTESPNSFVSKIPNEDKKATNTEILCSTCSQPVTDTCLELADQFYHAECLLCAGCNKTVPTDRKLSKIQGKLYCDHCSSNTGSKRTGPTGLKIVTKQKTGEALPKRNSITTPSDIFKSRTKGLPRLGGVRTCARCNESMPFSDTQPGPNASRWHKKCLRCAGCRKQMDSDAHMTINEETGLCLVHCRECLDETPKPRFVR